MKWMYLDKIQVSEILFAIHLISVIFRDTQIRCLCCSEFLPTNITIKNNFHVKAKCSKQTLHQLTSKNAFLHLVACIHHSLSKI